MDAFHSHCYKCANAHSIGLRFGGANNWPGQQDKVSCRTRMQWGSGSTTHKSVLRMTWVLPLVVLICVKLLQIFLWCHMVPSRLTLRHLQSCLQGVVGKWTGSRKNMCSVFAAPRPLFPPFDGQWPNSKDLMKANYSKTIGKPIEKKAHTKRRLLPAKGAPSNTNTYLVTAEHSHHVAAYPLVALELKNAPTTRGSTQPWQGRGHDAWEVAWLCDEEV